MKKILCGFMALLLFLGCMPAARGYAQEANEGNVVDMATY